MISFFKILQKIIRLFINLLFALQIVLMVLVFFSAAYWFFGVAGFDFFMFAEPIAEAIADFVKIFYNSQIEIAGRTIDGSILIFDIVSILIVFVITKSKYYIFKGAEFIDKIVDGLVQQEENKFNEALRIETEKRILNSNNAAIIVKLELKDLTIRKYRRLDQPQRNKEEKEELVFKMLYTEVKTLEGCKFAKNGTKLVIMLNEFAMIDDVLPKISQITDKIKAKLKEDSWETYCYIGAEVYDDKTDFRNTVYPALENLIKIKHSRGITCFGNFKMRYQYKKDQQYQIELFNSDYAIDGGSDIYVLVKKV
ncbi:hypothetical protein J6N69_05940 [bacterium]|nr:hypothetical protein [bacterium]